MSDASATKPPYSVLRPAEVRLFDAMDQTVGLVADLDDLDEWVDVGFDQWAEALAPLDEAFFQWAWTW